MGVVRPGNPPSVVWIGRFPLNSWFNYRPDPNADRVWTSRFTLGPALVSGTAGSRIWIGDAESGDVNLYDEMGAVTRSFRIRRSTPKFDERAVERARASQLASATSDVERIRIGALFASSIRPATAPVFRRFVPGIHGEMGVEMFSEDPGVPVLMRVFDRSGGSIGEVVLPAGLVAFELGRDFLLGVQTDADGVERVAMHRLVRR